MFTSFPSSRVLGRSFAVAALTASAWTVAGAQTVFQSTVPPVSFAVPSFTQSLSAPAQDALYSSSVSPDAADAGAAAAQTNLASLESAVHLPGVDAQYGRRRYGAPRYRGGNTNADGSEKYDFYAGVGLTLPVGSNSNYLTTSYGIQAGGGRNFNKHLGVNLEFDYDHFGLTGATIQQQAFLYDPTGTSGIAGYLDGNSHIWNFSVQPVYQIYSGEGLGAYITGGVGFYHKVTNFTLPEEEEDLFGDVFDVPETIDHYTSNAPGFDGGLGLTYKFSKFANERLYAEVRYVYIDNSSRPGITPATVYTYTGNNYFPQNSNTTSYIPIKFGIRF